MANLKWLSKFAIIKLIIQQFVQIYIHAETFTNTIKQKSKFSVLRDIFTTEN
jgi:hypothetical protein